MNIRELCNRFSARRHKRSRPHCHHRRFVFESLERRELLAGDLAITDLQLATNEGNPVDQVITGEQVYLRADWTSGGLARGDGYLVRFAMDGEKLDSYGTIYPRAGVIVSKNSFGNMSRGGPTNTGRYWLRGAWFATPGTHTVTVTIDAENSVAETNEGNNTRSFTFTTVTPDTLPDKLVWPVGGQQNVDWVCCNYVAIHPREDFAGGQFTLKSHAGYDISIANFGKMDEGVPVFAVAAGTVFGTRDGNWDRRFQRDDGSHNGETHNGLSIVHGDGWKSVYVHLARDTITVQAGDVVTPGQLLGYVGSSGNSSKPHLHFEMRHYGGVVETFYAPELYWHNPPAYVADTEQAFMDFGVSNIAMRRFEPPPAINVFPNDLTKSSPLVFWTVPSHKHAGDVVTNKWVRPDGTLRFDFEHTVTKTRLLGGIAQHFWPVANFNRIGTWYWVREVNGVEQIRVPFEVVKGRGVPSIRVGFSADEIFIDGRTTAVEFGTANLGSIPVQKTFLIKNHGYGDMTLGELSLPPRFSLVGDFPSTIPWQESAEFTVQLDTNRAGEKFGEIRFETNDPDIDVFNINIEGFVVGAVPADAPQISRPWPRAVGYAFRQGPVRIDDEIRLSNAGNSSFNGGSLVVDIDGSQPDDRLSLLDGPDVSVVSDQVSYGGQLIGTATGGTGSTPLVVDLNAAATPAAVEALLRSIAYSSDSATPSTRPRYIRFTLTNEAGLVSNQPYKKVVLADFEHNRAPNVTPVADQTATEDAPFAFTLPTSTFSDDNTFDGTLVLAAARHNGSPLPAWLSFDPQLRRFSGTPRNDHVGTLTVLVMATDLVGLTASDTFEIRVGNTNDPPMIVNSIPNQQVLEDSHFDFTFAKSTFADVDAGDSLAYGAALSDGSPLPSWLNFTANQNIFSGAPNNDDVGTFIVRVTATDEAGAAVSTALEIAVVNVNDPPVISLPISDQTATQDAAFDFTFSANTFRDVDAGDSLRYRATLSDGSSLPAWLAFDGAARRFQGTPGNSDVGTVTVTAQDLANTAAQDEFWLEVQNTNDAPTAIELDNTTVDEAVSGAIVATVTVSDPDPADSHDVSVSDSRFEVSDGKLKLKDGQSLDHETEAALEIVLRATDRGLPPLSFERRFTIEVRDVNEFNPTILDQTLSVDENAAAGVSLGTVIASDQDTSQSLTFAIAGGNAANAFAIDASSGEITVATPSSVDHEAATSFSLTVLVTDNRQPARSATAAIMINVNDINEFAPTISDQSLSIDENSAAESSVGTVAASDQDTSQSHSFAITAGNTNNAFAIDAATGTITVKAPAELDHETTPQFNLTVSVTDDVAPTRTATATVTVDILDVNEFDPVVQDQVFQIQESTRTNIGIRTIIATDQDESQSLTFAIVAGNENNLFDIYPTLGFIIVANSGHLDFEAASVHRLTVDVTDDGNPSRTSLATVIVEVTDANEFDPSVNDQRFSVAENAIAGTNVGTVIATDLDIFQTHTFAITAGNTDDAFAIDVLTGEITVATPSSVDHEATSAFSLTVEVTDSGQPPRSSQATVTIDVNDGNEPPSAIQLDNTEVLENILGAVVGQVTAEHQDLADTLTLSVSDERFEIVGDQLKLKDDESLRAAEATSISLSITAADSGAPPQSLVVAFDVTVLPNPTPWTNPLEQNDVNRDGFITPGDVRVLVNQLNAPTVIAADGRLATVRRAGSALPFYDANGDGFGTPADARVIVNFLNRQVLGGEGEVAIQPQPLNQPSSLLARDVLLAHDMLFADLSTKGPAEAVTPTPGTASPYSRLAAPAVKFQQRVAVSTSSCVGHHPKDLSLDETLNVALESIVENLCRAAL